MEVETAVKVVVVPLPELANSVMEAGVEELRLESGVEVMASRLNASTDRDTPPELVMFPDGMGMEEEMETPEE